MMIRLPWYENGDRLQVAIAANAAARAGYPVFRVLADTSLFEKGDYLVDGPVADTFLNLGLSVQTCSTDPGLDMQPIVAPRIALLAGACSAYPYYGYYALALLRLGYVFTIVDGEDIARGVLDSHDLLFLPGGFSNWTLDLKENTRGADDAVRRFLLRGGTVIGSCGGAYYFSRGRPGWLGVADARPINTQEYLRSGVGILTCSILDERLGLGLPPTIEIAYFHGPVWDELGEATEPVMTFRDYYGHGQLFINNPLSRDVFERDMQGRVAALRTYGKRGRSILFSPHPEMGDLLRKYMALETYIPRYQAIRGDLVMRETLATFRPEESRSFLLILNAVEELAREQSAFTRPDQPKTATCNTENLHAEWTARADSFEPSATDTGRLEIELLAHFRIQFADLLSGFERHWTDAGPDLKDMGSRLIADITKSLARKAGQRPAEILLELELACLILDGWSQVIAADRLMP
jgi:hypothetical protein